MKRCMVVGVTGAAYAVSDWRTCAQTRRLRSIDLIPSPLGAQGIVKVPE